MAPMNNNRRALALFSGGLDGMLAVKAMERQGFFVTCLHFTSPFFGEPERVRHWREACGLDVSTVDLGSQFVRMLADGVRFGFGKHLNPCLDCKILMLNTARKLLPELGAEFIITGEVLGQRPMSQRRDAMDIVSREAKVRGLLLRPLCARRLKPTPMEESGLVDRERLFGIAGRGRKDQLLLAKELGLLEISNPGGGCRLAVVGSARRYANVLARLPAPEVRDFVLANVGRQYWTGDHWLAVGRDHADNERLLSLAEEKDLVFTLENFPGPLAVGRAHPGASWDLETVRAAAAFTASFSPRARKSRDPVKVRVRRTQKEEVVSVTPARETRPEFQEPSGSDIAWVRERPGAGFLENKPLS
ncbi:MAG: tRNA(5-methylaminomethyl-2-thiouridylate) methyltransferase [Thermodesulfobacteriota bacterium]|nr:tRNA(5-methylaminomethyl-2-thiouridylate) methyltransferase [Thermodesulfobacteriota bacterium]